MLFIEMSEESLSRLIQKNVLAALATFKPEPEIILDDERLTIQQLAGYLNVSKATIQAYKKRGVVPFYQTGRTVYFKKSEVDAALANKKKGAKNA